MQGTVVLTTGLPGSGKSTWAVAEQAKDPNGTVLTSRDDIRKMIGCFPVGTKDQEELVSKIQDSTIVLGVKAGKRVIVHDTNLNQKSPKRIKRLFDGDVQFYVADFTNVSVDTCIARDALREQPVGEKVIRNMARQLNKPWRLTDAFMNDIVLSPLYVPKAGTRPAIVVDIDGTLASHDHRSPYDYSRVYTDGLRIPVARTVDLYAAAGYYVIALSGRPDINNVRKDTEEWMEFHGIPYNVLHMRPADMLTVNDADVKQFLFDTYVREDYDVDMVLDDRDRVVRRWRKLGLNTYQVAEGEF